MGPPGQKSAGKGGGHKGKGDWSGGSEWSGGEWNDTWSHANGKGGGTYRKFDKGKGQKYDRTDKDLPKHEEYGQPDPKRPRTEFFAPPPPVLQSGCKGANWSEGSGGKGKAEAGDAWRTGWSNGCTGKGPDDMVGKGCGWAGKGKEGPLDMPSFGMGKGPPGLGPHPGSPVAGPPPPFGPGMPIGPAGLVGGPLIGKGCGLPLGIQGLGAPPMAGASWPQQQGPSGTGLMVMPPGTQSVGPRPGMLALPAPALPSALRPVISQPAPQQALQQLQQLQLQQQQLQLPRPVRLAPATASIVPVSSRSSQSKQNVALQFISADKETQMRMLKDPNVAQAILQTLAENPGSGGLPAQMASLLTGASSPPPSNGMLALTAGTSPAASSASSGGPGPASSQWSGILGLARNATKRLNTRAQLHHGRAQDVELALRCAAGSNGALDITHRVPFEEVARRATNCTVISMSAASPMDQQPFEEYVKYFRSKLRAGVARLDGALVLYVLPAGDELAAVRDTLCALSPSIPRHGCLLGIIAQGTTPAGPASTPAKVPRTAGAASSTKGSNAALAAPVVAPLADETERREAAPVKSEPVEAHTAPVAAADAGEEQVDTGLSSSLMDLFSNPELIKLLSEDTAAAVS